RRARAAGRAAAVRAPLAEPAGLSPRAGQAVGYAEISAHLRREYSLERAVELIKTNTRHLGKHQRTWMRGMPGVTFVDVTPEDTVESVADRGQEVGGVD